MYKVAILDSEYNHYDCQDEKIRDLKCKDEILSQVGKDVAESLKENITVKQFSPCFKEYRLGYFTFSRDEMVDIIKQLKSVIIFCIPAYRDNVVKIIDEIEEKLHK